MKAVVEIIATVALLIGGVKLGPIALVTLKRESLMKIHKGLPSLEKFSKKLIKHPYDFK